MKITNPKEWDGTVFKSRYSGNVWYILILIDDVFLCYVISDKTYSGGSPYTTSDLEYKFSSEEWTYLFNISEVVKEARDEIQR